MIELAAYRLSDWDSPLPASPSRHDARYGRRGVRPVHYWSLHPHGPWAEYLRHHGLVGRADTFGLRKRLWAARLDLEPTVIGFDDASKYGLTPHDLVSDDYSACQDLADRLVAAGVDVVQVPAAALPGTDNLVLFGDRVEAPYQLGPVDPALDVPCAVAAEDAHGQPELHAFVRHVGQSHLGLQAWKAGTHYIYPQPARSWAEPPSRVLR